MLFSLRAHEASGAFAGEVVELAAGDAAAIGRVADTVADVHCGLKGPPISRPASTGATSH